MLKLVTLLVLLVCTVVGARSCSSSSPASPLNPLNVARNGLNSACADQQAVADAGGGTGGDTGTLVPPAAQEQLGSLVGSPLSCTTTTVPDQQP